MIAHAKAKSVKAISSTNGLLFARADHAEALVRSGLDTIIFAIDGTTARIYEQYRQGGSLAAADEYSLGSVRDSSLWEVWSGESYRRIRREFKRDWSSMGLCGECSYAYEGGSLACETIAEALFFDRPPGTRSSLGEASG